MAVLSLPATLGIAWALLPGDYGLDLPAAVRRGAGLTVYWLLMGLIALSITLLARNTLVPLVVFTVNGGLVSFSLLLSRVTNLARYLPDVAGLRLFTTDTALADPLPLALGAIVMAAWAVTLLTAACLVFVRRDA
jgi:hypothetical protein